MNDAIRNVNGRINDNGNRENRRYGRQTAFTPFGERGQRRLEKGRVLIVGCGALGGTVANLLIRAGVGVDGGVVTIIDFDVVQTGNLHRQTLFTEEDARCSRRKVDAIRAALLAADGRANIETRCERFGDSHSSLVRHHDLLIDATDCFPTRFVMNRSALRYGKPFIFAGISGASGQLMTVFPGETACLECLLPADAEKKAPVDGILGPLPQMMASWEALEAMKILSGHREAVHRSVVTVDLWNNQVRSFGVERDEECPACGEGR